MVGIALKSDLQEINVRVFQLCRVAPDANYNILRIITTPHEISVGSTLLPSPWYYMSCIACLCVCK